MNTKEEMNEEVVEKEENKKTKKKDNSELLKMTEMYHELEDKLKLSQAEMINFRRRKEEETSNMLKYANMDFANEILPIIDNFERAITFDDSLSEEIKKYLEGFKIIYGALNDILKKFEVTEIDCLDKPFDPNNAQALMTEKKDGVEPNYVTEVLQKGYMIKDRLLRPALVKVSE